VALVRTDVSEHIASIIRVKRISELGIMLGTLLVTDNIVFSLLVLFTLMMEAISSSEMLGLTRATRRHDPEDGILHSHYREILKSYSVIELRMVYFSVYLFKNILDVWWHTSGR
jgi:hypothetical protein